MNKVLGHLINAQVLGYCERAYFESFCALVRQTEKTLNGYMNYVRQQKAGDESRGVRTLKENLTEYDIDPEAEQP